MDELREIEAIKRLKYRYFRCLDQKRWEELAECFVENATSAYSDGKFSFAGREEIMRFLVGALDRPTILTAHTGHHPEIDLVGADRAIGVWALEDTVIDVEHKVTIRGAGFYRDEYVKIDGRWKLKSTGYQRTFEEIESRADTPSLTLTANRFDTTTAKSEKVKA